MRPHGRWREVPHWTPAESATLDRFASAVRDGLYSNAVVAVPDCRVALARLRRGARTDTPRSRNAVHHQLILRARRLGRPWVHARWHDEERALLDRFAQAAANGRYQTAREAARACAEALRRLHRRFPRRYAGVPDRVVDTIQSEIWPRLAKLRYRWFSSHWSVEEKAIMDRYARAVVAHRYPHARAAAHACCKETNRLHARFERRSVRGVEAPVVRTLDGVAQQVRLRARELARFQVPRRHADWLPVELRVVERYARRVGQGDFRSWRAAAQACQAELRGLYAELGAGSHLRPGRIAGRGLYAMRGRLLLTAHQLGLPVPHCMAWTPREDKALAEWLRWYDKYRVKAEHGPLRAASTGLQEELEELGFSRTVLACRTRLKNAWLELHGLA